MKKHIFGLLLTALSTISFAGDRPMPGDAGPAISGTSIRGEAIDSTDYRGQEVSLVFIDTLCPMPHWPDCETKLERIRQFAASSGETQWLGIAKGFYIDENWVKAFARKHRLDFPIIWDQDNRIFSDYTVFGNPYQIWLDEKGNLISRGKTITATARR